MKKLITTLILILCISTVLKAQQRLPDTISIRLSAKEYIAIISKLDSMQNLFLRTTVVPSNMAVPFNDRLNNALEVVFKQVQKQVIDKPKKGGAK